MELALAILAVMLAISAATSAWNIKELDSRLRYLEEINEQRKL